MSGSKGFDISGEGNEILQLAFRDYGRYLVGMAWLDKQNPDSPKAEFCSGFIIEIGDTWYLVTAGHILKHLPSLIQTNQVGGFLLNGSYGHAIGASPIHFELADAWQFSVHDPTEGLDFGAVEIASHDRKLLEANGILPIRETEWRQSDFRKYPQYIMLGLPTDSIERSLISNEQGAVVRGRADASIIISDQIDVPPAYQTRHPRVFASLSKEWSEGDVDGMSGGPLFGIDDSDEKPPIVGVQSQWSPDERFIVACPVSVFAPILEEQVKRR